MNTALEVNWNTYLLGKVVGYLDSSRVPKGYDGFEEIFNKYYNTLKKSGIEKMWKSMK